MPRPMRQRARQVTDRAIIRAMRNVFFGIYYVNLAENHFEEVVSDEGLRALLSATVACGMAWALG